MSLRLICIRIIRGKVIEGSTLPSMILVDQGRGCLGLLESSIDPDLLEFGAVKISAFLVGHMLVNLQGSQVY